MWKGDIKTHTKIDTKTDKRVNTKTGTKRETKAETKTDIERYPPGHRSGHTPVEKTRQSPRHRQNKTKTNWKETGYNRF